MLERTIAGRADSLSIERARSPERVHTLERSFLSISNLPKKGGEQGGVLHASTNPFDHLKAPGKWENLPNRPEPKPEYKKSLYEGAIAYGIYLLVDFLVGIAPALMDSLLPTLPTFLLLLTNGFAWGRLSRAGYYFGKKQPVIGYIASAFGVGSLMGFLHGMLSSGMAIAAPQFLLVFAALYLGIAAVGAFFPAIFLDGKRSDDL